MKRIITTALCVITMLGVAGPVSAQEPPGGSVGYKKYWILCANEGGLVDIGGAVTMQEIGSSHVNQFRVKWLLYNTPNPTGSTLAYKRWTVESSVFPDDAKSYKWTTPKQKWLDNVASDSGYTLVAKLTWVRPGRKDWNHRFPFVYCS